MVNIAITTAQRPLFSEKGWNKITYKQLFHWLQIQRDIFLNCVPTSNLKKTHERLKEFGFSLNFRIMMDNLKNQWNQNFFNTIKPHWSHYSSCQFEGTLSLWGEQLLRKAPTGRWSARCRSSWSPRLGAGPPSCWWRWWSSPTLLSSSRSRLPQRRRAWRNWWQKRSLSKERWGGKLSTIHF